MRGGRLLSLVMTAAALGARPHVARGADGIPGTIAPTVPALPTGDGAAGLAPRQTAAIAGERWAYSLGVFNPLTINVGRGLEVQTHPLLFLVAPHFVLRVPHRAAAGADARAWLLTGEYGLSIPTVAMRLLQGTLFPAWENQQGHIGWAIVPRAGLVATRATGAPAGQTAVVTARLDVAVGIPLSATDAQPLDAPQPLNLLFDPVLSRYRARIGLLWDGTMGRRWRARVYGDLYLHGVERDFQLPTGWDQVTTRAGVGFDVGFGAHLQRRLTFGVAWWNSYQHAIDPNTWQARRSNDIWPTLDFIWGP